MGVWDRDWYRDKLREREGLKPDGRYREDEFGELHAWPARRRRASSGPPDIDQALRKLRPWRAWLLVVALLVGAIAFAALWRHSMEFRFHVRVLLADLRQWLR